MTPEARTAIDAVERRARSNEDSARRRIAAALGDIDVEAATAGLMMAARITVNFHPDRLAPGGTVVEGLVSTGVYRSQFTTGISNGSRSAIEGGFRTELERGLFGDAYDDAPEHRPAYGTLDLLNDTRGGSPGFGSCHLVLRPEAAEHCTFTVGDSYLGPTDVGTVAAPLSLLAGLADQAAATDLLGRPLGVEILTSILRGEPQPPTTDRRLESYIEAHVHGGIDLRHDVAEVVADPAFADRDTGRHLRALADLAGVELSWHGGNELAAERFPADFRRPDLPEMAAEVARADGIVDAAVIGDRARTIEPGPPTLDGDQADHPLQWVKHLWQALVVFGDDARPTSPTSGP